MRERAIEAALTGAIREAGGHAIKLSAPGESGWPDRLVLLPGGIAAFVELKAPGKKARPLQLYRQQQLRDLGFMSEIVDSKEGVSKFIERMIDDQ